MWSWILTAVGIWGMYLAGKKNRLGWLVGLLAEFLWIWYAIVTAQWGFLVGAAFYIWVFGKNWWEWRQDDVRSARNDARADGGSVENTV